jgi:hypothetical protein
MIGPRATSSERIIAPRRVADDVRHDELGIPTSLPLSARRFVPEKRFVSSPHSSQAATGFLVLSGVAHAICDPAR